MLDGPVTIPTGFETGAVDAAWLRTSPPKAQVKASGGGRESNPPASSRRHTGFEVRGRWCCQVLSDASWCHPVQVSGPLRGVWCPPVTLDHVLDVCNVFAGNPSPER